MSAKPAIPTSATFQPLYISYTENATHVYIMVEEPKGLSSRFEGPYAIVSHPSRSRVQVRLGSYVNGEPWLQTYNWRSFAHLRPDAKEGSRPALGRKPAPDKSGTSRPAIPPVPSEQSGAPITISNTPHPEYLKKGPLVTQKMFDEADWPKILQLSTTV